MLTHEQLLDLSDQLVAVPGVVGVTLGGSRARGAERPDSDVDLGLYYRPPLDTVALRRLAGTVAGARSAAQRADVTEPGGWGPWVDGGGWLTVADEPVDWIYRDLDRVRRSSEQALAGEFQFHFQVGHPFGFPDFGYAGELALGIVLADPTGELGRLQDGLDPYPVGLGKAVVARLEEARFLLGPLAKSAGRADTTFVAGCLFRVVILCAHAVHARAGRWVINEKGLVDAAGTLPTAPPDFPARAHGVLARLGRHPEQLRLAVESAWSLLRDCSES